LGLYDPLLAVVRQVDPPPPARPRDPPGSRFDLKRTAGRLGLSPDYMPRWFRAQVGIPLHTYLIRVRAHAARHMHEQDGMKIDRLASAAGFSDASHLSRRFKDVFGHRPGQRRLGTR
jgi:AraC-like DNA-binding protein